MLQNAGIHRETLAATQERSDALYVERSRKRLKLTQAELADKLGIERRSIGRFENGAPLPLQTRLAIRYLLQSHVRKKRRCKDENED